MPRTAQRSSVPKPQPIPLRPADKRAEGDLDTLFETIVDSLRRDVRRLRQHVERFRRAYQKRSATDDEPTRRAFRRLRQLQLVADAIESSGAYLVGSGIAPQSRDRERTEIADSLLESLEAERERLMRDVHDGPAQVLANAIFEIEYLERIADRAPTDVRQALRMELGTLKGHFRTSLDGVRAMIYDLRPPVLSELGLAGAMRTYANEYESRYGLKAILHLDDRETGLDPQQELAVYRVMQEAMQNTHKHGQATTVRIRWERDGEDRVLHVTDDGTGFDIVRAARQPRSVGLVSMRQRAELIGGRFEIRSVPGQGTTVSLRIPGRKREEAP